MGQGDPGGQDQAGLRSMVTREERVGDELRAGDCGLRLPAVPNFACFVGLMVTCWPTAWWFGRIMKAAAKPADASWLWTLA
jgi:hypothetical protein